MANVGQLGLGVVQKVFERSATGVGDEFSPLISRVATTAVSSSRPLALVELSQPLTVWTLSFLWTAEGTTASFRAELSSI